MTIAAANRPEKSKSHRLWIVLLTLVIGSFNGSTLLAQNNGRCFFLCTPELKFEPTVTVGNLFRPAKVAKLEAGVPTETSEPGREATFEMIFAVDIPTEIPRVGLTFEAIWAPFEGTEENVFTGATASQLGVSKIQDNPVELEFELNLHWLESEQTRGWIGSHFDIVDQYSPSARPNDRGLYTHKLNFELDTSISVFNWLPQRNWLRNLELEFSLDYLATGIPKTGDVFHGEEVFLRGESPWSLSILVVIPLAPLRP